MSYYNDYVNHRVRRNSGSGNVFVNAMKEDSSFTKTTNGMTARNTTGSYCLDFFATVGAMRNSSEAEVQDKFFKAFCEDKLIAMKTLFYGRDVRGGLGERRISRVIYKYLAMNYPNVMEKNIEIIPFFGRWDDLYVFVDTPVEDAMWKFFAKTLRKDIYNMKHDSSVTLLAKWAKCWNSGNKDSKILGRKSAKAMGMNNYEYQKAISALRKYIDVVEVKMSSKKWNRINYEAVPSCAMHKHNKAFYKHDESRFKDYLGKVQRGEKKINASAVYPYELVGKYVNFAGDYDCNTHKYIFRVNPADSVVEEQWKALPNYVSGHNNVLVMADTSGSMRGMPINSAIGLGIYFAERNSGPYKNKIMTFSDSPVFVDVVGNTLNEKVRSCVNSHWDNNTNIMKAMRKILAVALENNLSSDDLPKALVIISDMQFDNHSDMGRNKDMYTYLENEFAAHGYTLPNIIFWNVNGPKTFHAKQNSRGVQMYSGNAVSNFKEVLSAIGYNPYEAMIKALSNSRYDCVKV